ncbi:hypothetical protein Q3G72_026953 [Acer saccharum]|nr:hypothetical protein Q3G72_026953 [Acer saccharum]
MTPSVQAKKILDSLHELERAEFDDSDVEPEPESTRVLKRLRRGPGPTTQSLSSSLLAKKKKQQLGRTCSGNGDDDIEEFSSPEDLIFRAWAAPFLMEFRFAVLLQIMSLLASHRSLIGYTAASACHTRFFHSLENLQSSSMSNIPDQHSNRVSHDQLEGNYFSPSRDTENSLVQLTSAQEGTPNTVPMFPLTILHTTYDAVHIKGIRLEPEISNERHSHKTILGGVEFRVEFRVDNGS